jgi:hypothetical protein
MGERTKAAPTRPGAGRVTIMAALLALPAVAFAVLVTILYEDRLLPQADSGPKPLADAGPAAGTALASPAVADAVATEEPAPAPVPVAAEPVDAEPADVTAALQPARPRGRHCEVRRDASSPARPRVHRPVVGSVRRTAAPSRPAREVHLEGAVSLPGH